MSVIRWCETCQVNFEVFEGAHLACEPAPSKDSARLRESPDKIWINVRKNWEYMSDGVFGTAQFIKPYNNPQDYPVYMRVEDLEDIRETQAVTFETLASQLEDLAYQYRGKAADLRKRSQ